MVSGTLWMVLMRWVIRLIGLINTAILARLLVPEDFGLVALAMIVVDLCITLTDGDIEMALIRQTKTSRSLQDTGWTLKILAGFLTAGAIWALAPFAATSIGDERIIDVMAIAALRPLILGFESIGVVEFRRSLNFSREFKYLVLQRVLTFVGVLGLVLSWRSYLALAWAMPLSALITVALSYTMAPRQPRLSLRHWRELWHFSRWQMLFNSARLVSERCDPLVISRLGSVADTGVYVVAFDLAMMPGREIMLPAGRALMPAYAKIFDNPEAVKANFQTVLGFSAIIAGAVGVGMSVVAEDAVALILGEQWSAAVPFVRWLGLYSALEGLWLMLDPLLIAMRLEKTLAAFNLFFSLLILFVVTLTGFLAGSGAIPLARIAVMVVVLSVVLSWMAKWGWITPSRLLAAMWRSAIAAAVMAAGVQAAHRTLFADPLPSLLADIGLGMVLYAVSLFGLWMGSGRPAGAEAILAEMGCDRTRRFFGRLKRRS